jgi:hypothetical protein
MHGRWVVPLVLLGGCNGIFGLDPTHGGDDDIADDDVPPIDSGVFGHDEDGDGVDDGHDNCPSLSNPDQTNDDGDLVGTDCDPNANADGDTILHFDAFDTDESLTRWGPVRGSWQIADDTLQQTDATEPSGLAMATYDLSAADDITIEVVASVVAQHAYNGSDPTAPRGLGTWFITAGGSGADDPKGYICQVITDLAVGTTDFTLWVNGTTPMLLDTDSFQASPPLGTVGRTRASRLPAGVGYQLCTASVGDNTVGTLEGADGTFVVGGAGLRTIWTNTRFHSVTIYGKGD